MGLWGQVHFRWNRRWIHSGELSVGFFFCAYKSLLKTCTYSFKSKLKIEYINFWCNVPSIRFGTLSQDGEAGLTCMFRKHMMMKLLGWSSLVMVICFFHGVLMLLWRLQNCWLKKTLQTRAFLAKKLTYKFSLGLGFATNEEASLCLWRSS